MGHRKYSAPRRGSLAYLPRGRASHWTPRIRYWPNYEGAPRLLGFAGFKAGTTHVTVVDNRQGSLNYGKEVTFPVTVVETPPLKVAALRFYEMRDKDFEPSVKSGRTIKTRNSSASSKRRKNSTTPKVGKR